LDKRNIAALSFQIILGGKGIYAFNRKVWEDFELSAGIKKPLTLRARGLWI
jgi:hypothetical protein